MVYTIIDHFYGLPDKLSRTEEMLDKADSELDRANVRIKNIKKKNDCCCFALVCCCCMKDPDKYFKIPIFYHEVHLSSEID